MPFYEYECPACKYYAEVLQKISDKPLAKCPSCGKKGFKRLMSAPVFRLKGSGWYETGLQVGPGQQAEPGWRGARRGEARLG
jgi:putative FmdB family regulatory protein